MLALISFILVVIGSLNWFSIGILQFDFVAGIFGSQSNIFSRLIYTLVGIASIVMVVNFVTNKGKFVVSFRKADKEFEEMQEEKKAQKRRALATESSEDFSLSRKLMEDSENNYNRNYNTESATDYESTNEKKNKSDSNKNNSSKNK